MLKTTVVPDVVNNDVNKKRVIASPLKKRAHSVSSVSSRPRSPPFGRKIPERRCQSLSPSHQHSKKPERFSQNQGLLNDSDDLNVPTFDGANCDEEPCKDNEPAVPQCILMKMIRNLASKKREFIKLRKTVIAQQNCLLENYAAVRELETRAGVTSDESIGDVRILSVTGWPAHDLLLLVRDDLETPLNTEISGMFGPQILQQLYAQLNPIPEDVLGMGAEIMARRIDLLNLFRTKHRTDRAYLSNLEWKNKNTEFDQETEKLHRMVAGIAENLKAKLTYAMDLAKLPWLDREALEKKAERLQKENLILHHKLGQLKKDNEEGKDVPEVLEGTLNYEAICEELAKEKSAREALKEVVTAAESMLRVARARIATLERQLKDTKAELDTAKKKQKDLEQLCRHRESSFDARSRKLLEVSKTGEVTIEDLSRQRDALELRVKELREQAEAAEKSAEVRNAEMKSRIDSLQAKVAEQEKNKKIAEARVIELEAKMKELEDLYQALRERSIKIVDTERRRCLEYIPSKENEPSDKDTQLWKELQETRLALSRTEEELRQSRADKNSFLESLSRIAQGEDEETFKSKMSIELLDREKKIVRLQHTIEELCDNEKSMEESMTQYENQLAALRLEVKRLRNYDCYAKEIPHQELQSELLELHMRVQTLSRERTGLITAAASRALMLERHERAAELFARMTRARRDLAALIDGRTESPAMDESTNIEISKSLTSVCANASSTWSALRAERARVLRLESAVLSQNMQLEREARARTQLERRRALLERELLRAQHSLPDSNTDRKLWHPSAVI